MSTRSDVSKFFYPHSHTTTSRLGADLSESLVAVMALEGLSVTLLDGLLQRGHEHFQLQLGLRKDIWSSVQHLNVSYDDIWVHLGKAVELTPVLLTRSLRPADVAFICVIQLRARVDVSAVMLSLRSFLVNNRVLTNASQQCRKLLPRHSHQEIRPVSAIVAGGENLDSQSRDFVRALPYLSSANTMDEVLHPEKKDLGKAVGQEGQGVLRTIHISQDDIDFYYLERQREALEAETRRLEHERQLEEEQRRFQEAQAQRERQRALREAQEEQRRLEEQAAEEEQLRRYLNYGRETTTTANHQGSASSTAEHPSSPSREQGGNQSGLRYDLRSQQRPQVRDVERPYSNPSATPSNSNAATPASNRPLPPPTPSRDPSVGTAPRSETVSRTPPAEPNGSSSKDTAPGDQRSYGSTPSQAALEARASDEDMSKRPETPSQSQPAQSSQPYPSTGARRVDHHEDPNGNTPILLQHETCVEVEEEREYSQPPRRTGGRASEGIDSGSAVAVRTVRVDTPGGAPPHRIPPTRKLTDVIVRQQTTPRQDSFRATYNPVDRRTSPERDRLPLPSSTQEHYSARLTTSSGLLRTPVVTAPVASTSVSRSSYRPLLSPPRNDDPPTEVFVAQEPMHWGKEESERHYRRRSEESVGRGYPRGPLPQTTPTMDILRERDEGRGYLHDDGGRQSTSRGRPSASRARYEQLEEDSDFEDDGHHHRHHHGRQRSNSRRRPESSSRGGRTTSRRQDYSSYSEDDTESADDRPYPNPSSSAPKIRRGYVAEEPRWRSPSRTAYEVSQGRAPPVIVPAVTYYNPVSNRVHYFQPEM
jgi:hypothetical protein